MGGFGSGNHGGRPTANMSKRIDLAWMIRTGKAVPGQFVHGSLWWNVGGSPAGSISYSADMTNLEAAELKLAFTRGSGDEREEVKQCIRLVYTVPHFGGRRWWMICPYSGRRVGKLYMPNGGDRFAGRKAWRLAYNSQRVGKRDQSFEKLFRLQRKLGCPEGFENYPTRPKGMWQRTFDRHLDRWHDLDEQCAAEMTWMVLRLGR